MSEPRITRRRFLTLLPAALLAALGGKMYWNVYRPVVSRHRIEVAGLARPLRAVQLSDLHYGPYIGEESLDAWAELAAAENPDLILITGDFVDHWLDSDLAPLGRALARLRAPLGIWGVWGNHDRVRFPDIHVLQHVLEDAGIQLLTNQGQMVRDDFYLAGVDDLLTATPDLRAALTDQPRAAASMLLSHNPDLLPYVPEDVGVTLCGHTHGGQVVLPYLGAPVTSSRFGQQFLSGWVFAPARAFVSRGLGATLLPIRLDCPPELAVIDLLPG
ncbi:MAG TPA: metallophosphoesterase [Trueperaceae bacterium]